MNPLLDEPLGFWLVHTASGHSSKTSILAPLRPLVEWALAGIRRCVTAVSQPVI